jgi:polyisoprenoid-binding protein YceI
MTKLTRSFAHVVVLTALTLGAASVTLGETVLQIEPAQTKVEFTLGDILHTVHGEFRLKRGDIHFDPATGAAGGELVVDAASGTSGSDARDSRMHKKILETDRYPEIVFRPDRVDGKVAPEGQSHVQLHGIFSIHGADHEISMPVDVKASAGQYTTTATFVVPYVKWGMKNPSTLILRVSQQVDITVHTVAKAR